VALNYNTIIAMTLVNTQWLHAVQKTAEWRKDMLKKVMVKKFSEVRSWFFDAITFHPFGCAAAFFVLTQYGKSELCVVQAQSYNPNSSNALGIAQEALPKLNTLSIHTHKAFKSIFDPINFTVADQFVPAHFKSKDWSLVVGKDEASHDHTIFCKPFYTGGKFLVHYQKTRDGNKMAWHELSVDQRGTFKTDIFKDKWYDIDQKLSVERVCQNCTILNYNTIITMALVNTQWWSAVTNTTPFRTEKLKKMILFKPSPCDEPDADTITFHPLGCVASFLKIAQHFSGKSATEICVSQVEGSSTAIKCSKLTFKDDLEPCVDPFCFSSYPSLKSGQKNRFLLNWHVIFNTNAPRISNPFFENGKFCTNFCVTINKTEQAICQLSIDRIGKMTVARLENK